MKVSGVWTDGAARSQQLGKYRLVATLGQGGMGTVHLAFAGKPGLPRKPLVVKELRQDLTRRAGFVSMFMDEAKLTARLHHPNVVQTFEAGKEGDRYYIAMEYLDGQPLSALIDRLASSNRLPLWVHIQILCEVLSGLHYAHRLTNYDGSSLGVVHRDMSPQNVFVTYDGHVKVVDFGVAKAGGASSLTDPGIFKGKFAYAAPEQVLCHPVDARADVFAVGIMLFEAISGRRFSDTGVSPQALRDRRAGREPRIRTVVPDVVPHLAEICDRALAVNPDDRFSSAEAFRAALREYLQDSEVRVGAPEIGALVREAFATERREIHRVIERSVQNGGASESAVAAVSFARFEEPTEVTPVADLSSLLDLSHEREDDKTRHGYARSKDKLGESSGLDPAFLEQRAQETETFQPPPPVNKWLLASTGLSSMSLAVALVVVFTQHSAPEPAPASTPSVRTESVALPARAQVESQPPAMQPPPEPQQQPMAEATNLESDRPLRDYSRRVMRRAKAAGDSKLTRQPVVTVTRESAFVPPELAAEIESADALEMSSKLRRGRRGQTRNDTEDPSR